MKSVTEFESLPNAKMLLSSLRSVGYTTETAIADIIDNSISARATKIELYFDWDEKRILVADNGNGMSEEGLLESMKIGSADPNGYRSDKDLGRFGMGMKTASFSLAKNLFVISKDETGYHNAGWDLEYVENENKWNILIKHQLEIEKLIENTKGKIRYYEYNTGTLIVISNLDRLIDLNNMEKSKYKFYNMIKKVKKHLSMIFHRFMEEDELEIYVNNNLLSPWNPFVRYNIATQELAVEELSVGKSQVTIEPYILPHKTKFINDEEFELAGGARGWLNHQGFYVYRNRRLIVYGTWFDKLKKEVAYNLARIKLDINSDSDLEWGIDIKKSKAIPPIGVEESIMQVAYLAIERSVAVYNSRGTYNKKSGGMNASLKYVWEQRRNSSGKYMFYLNKKHPVLMKIINEIGDDLKPELRTYLSLVENYSPAMLSGLIESENSQKNVEEIQEQKDIISIIEKVRVLKRAHCDNEEIYEVLAETPEYSYLKGKLKEIIEEAR